MKCGYCKKEHPGPKSWCADCRAWMRGYQRERRASLREHGICMWCSADVEADRKGYALCLKCSKKQTRLTAEWVRRRNDLGLCECGNGLDPDVSDRKCRSCIMTERMHARLSYARARVNGVCTQCRKADPEPGRILCAPCRRALTGYQAERRKEYARKGLCGSCGKRKPSKGRKWCKPCRERNSIYAKRSRERNRKEGLQ